MKPIKPLINLVFTLFIVLEGQSQVTSFYNPINPLKVSQGDVFNITMILGTNTPTTSKFKLFGLVINKQSGVILEAFSQEFNINNGSNNIPQLNLTYNYNLKDKSIASTGVIPFGSYRFECQITDNFNEPVSYCETEVEILPLSPPQLAFPDNNSSIETTLPTLFWIPPFPNPSDGINYHLRLVEKLTNQSSNEALSLNAPILEKIISDINTYQYTPSNFPLHFGKNYSWQIVAFSKSGGLIGQTEVWEFRIEKENKTRNFDSTYIVLNKENLNRTFKTKEKNLFIKFEENYKQGNLKVKVLSLDGNDIDCQNLTRKISGENRITINFSDCPNIKQGSIYLVEIEVNKNEKYSIRTFID